MARLEDLRDMLVPNVAPRDRLYRIKRRLYGLGVTHSWVGTREVRFKRQDGTLITVAACTPAGRHLAARFIPNRRALKTDSQDGLIRMINSQLYKALKKIETQLASK